MEWSASSVMRWTSGTAEGPGARLAGDDDGRRVAVGDGEHPGQDPADQILVPAREHVCEIVRVTGIIGQSKLQLDRRLGKP